ncbi:MAG: hypothetical protein WD850_00005, partial [Candidatus Spechtbacterales bacterium]
MSNKHTLIIAWLALVAGLGTFGLLAAGPSQIFASMNIFGVSAPVVQSGVQLADEEAFLASLQREPAGFPIEGGSVASLGAFLGREVSLKNSPTRNSAVGDAHLSASSAVAVEANSGQVLYQVEAQQQRSIASLTKLALALVIAERLALDETVVVSQRAADMPPTDANLEPGEHLSVHTLLYALLMQSANDAAVVLEEHYNAHYAPSSNNLVTLMNEKAQKLG